MAKTPRRRRTPARKRRQKPPPKCKAILLCDQTIIEAVTGKVSIIGTFTNFMLPSFPGSTRLVHAFVQVTDGIDRYAVVVEIHDLKEDKVLARSQPMEIQFPEKLSKLNLVIPIPPLPLSHPGTYDVVVFADGQEIDRQKFQASSKGDPNAAEARPNP